MDHVYKDEFPDDYDLFDVIPKKHRPDISAQKKAEKLPVPKIRSDEEWAKIFEKYPTTNDGYVLSFLPHQSEQYLHYLKKYGFCVIKVLEPQECEETIAELFDELNQHASNRQVKKLSRNDPSSWEQCNWPSASKFLTSLPAFGQKAFNNRTNEKMYQIFCAIFGETRLWCSVDKWGIFRGTKDLPFSDEDGNITLMDRPDWRHQLRPHWDVNPWVLVKQMQEGEWEMYQGLVALDDCPEEVGGFQTVPGSYNYLPVWCSEHKAPSMKAHSTPIPLTDPMIKYFQRVPLRKGEIVIWNGGQAHCNFANHSPKMRLYQFIRMLPAFKECQNKDRFSPRKIMKQYPDLCEKWSKDIQFTTLGRKLVSLDQWENNEPNDYAESVK